MKTEQGFDGVLLDFDGSLSEKSIALLPLVAPLLKHRAIYGINVLGVRDVKETYLDCFVKPKSNGWLDNMGMPKEEFIDKNRLGVLRDKGITAVMLRAINNSQLNENFSSLYRALPKGRRPSSEILGDVLLQGPAQQLKHRLDLIDNLADYLKTKTISPYFALLRGVFSTDPLIPEKIERNIYEAVGGYNYFSDFVVVKQFVGDIENLLENYVPAKFRKYIYGSMTTDNLIRYYDTLSSRDKYNLN